MAASVATALSITVTHGISGSYTKAGAFSTAVQSPAISWARTYTLGTSSGLADIWFEKSVTATTGGVSLDFSGSFTDDLGQTVSLTKIKELFIYNTSTTAGLTVTLTGNLITTAFGTITNIVVHPSGVFKIGSPIDGYTVTNSTADTLTMTTSSSTAAVYVVGLGVNT